MKGTKKPMQIDDASHNHSTMAAYMHTPKQDLLSFLYAFIYIDRMDIDVYNNIITEYNGMDVCCVWNEE